MCLRVLFTRCYSQRVSLFCTSRFAFYSNWPSPIENHTALAPNEHPRIIFRKDDLPRLRHLAATNADAQAIVARLKDTLNRTNFTNWHAPGYCFLYQIEQDAQWAAKAQDALQQGFDGAWGTDDSVGGTTYVRSTSFFPVNLPFIALYISLESESDRRYVLLFRRYNWKWFESCWNKQRIGPVAAAAALAYDMCYDAWSSDFRNTALAGFETPLYPCGQKFFNTHSELKIETCGGDSASCPSAPVHYDTLIYNLFQTCVIARRTCSQLIDTLAVCERPHTFLLQSAHLIP